MKANNTSLLGQDYGFIVGWQTKTMGMEIFARQNSLENDITHDDTSRTITHKQSYYGINANIYLGSPFYLRFGYLKAKIDQDVEGGATLNTNTKNEIFNQYDLQEDKESEGILYGIGASFFDKSKIGFVINFDRINIRTKDTKMFLLHLGVRISWGRSRRRR